MTTTTVSYNRQTRNWELKRDDETLATFPAGANGKRAAQIHRLELLNPKALDLALETEKLFPQLNGRPIRAAEIVAGGGVALDMATGIHEVQSQNGRELPYLVEYWRGLWLCNCIDCREGGAPLVDGISSHCCKHILAVLFEYDNDNDQQIIRCPYCGAHECSH